MTLEKEKSEELKKCCRCHDKKPETEFQWRIKGVKRQYACRQCRLLENAAKKLKREQVRIKKTKEDQEEEKRLFDQMAKMKW